MDIHWPSGVITVYKTDSFMTFVGGDVYNMDTELFRRALKDREDDPIGMAFPDTHRHNTTVLLGGIEYARIVEILEPYTITFDDADGPWVCNLVGSNNNILDRANLTSVQVRSNNSAGLTQMVEIQHSSFENGVWVDQLNGISGTTYPAGTPRAPVNNIADARTICEFRGFSTIYVIDDLILGTGDDVSRLMLIGKNAARTLIQIYPDADTHQTEIREAAVTGTLDGSSILRQCYVFDLGYVNGFIFNCQLAGTITLGGVMPCSLMDCFAAVNGVEIDMAGSGHSLNASSCTGHITISNKTGSDPCVMHISSATVTLAPSVINGAGIRISGLGEFNNLSSVEPDHVDMLSAESIWARIVDGDLSAEETMRIMLAALAGKRQGLGTSTEEYMGQDGITPRITLSPDQYGNGTPTVDGAP